MKTLHRLIFSLILGGTLLIGCNNSDILQIETGDELQDYTGTMVLGEQLENPYSVENMQKALDVIKQDPTLKSSTSDIEQIEIKTTHLYVRFLPKDENELNILNQDTLLNYYDYPLDYEIVKEGDYYHDPSLPDTVFTWEYTVVEPNYKFPEIQYEVLAELFILEEEDDEEDLEGTAFLKNSHIPVSIWEKLEDKSLELTDNEDEPSDEPQLKWWNSKWRPAGRITVQDDVLGKIGIRGLKVQCRRWFTTSTGFTNSDGYYSCNKRFRNKARYEFKWERYEFQVRANYLFVATKTGPNQRKKNWNWHITGSEDKHRATIFRAAYHYYYQDIKGLKRPPKNSFWKPQMKIAALDKEGSVNGSYAKDIRLFGLISPIRIFNNKSNNTQDVYATTIHELAHASHWEFMKNNWHSIDLKVQESWARGVQWELTRMKYKSYDIKSSYSRCGYTGVVQDLIDKKKKVTSYYYYTSDNSWNASTKSYYDEVSGYSIKQIEDALRDQKTWDGWKNNIDKKHKNETKKYLVDTFKYWGNK